MGGSLGLALRRRGWRVTGIGRNPARLARAKTLRALDETSTDPAAANGADVVALCVPVDQIVPWAKVLKPHLGPRALITDVGSVKGAIVREFDRIFPGDAPAAVGAHPMAGSEKTGVDAARADLYQDATCVLTPGPRTSPGALRRAEAFWRSVGARTLTLTPDVHDRWVALVSHLPHLAADALVLAAGARTRTDRDRDILARVAAGSFRDATRVAGADPALWRAIFTMNDRAVRDALADFRRALDGLAAGRWPRGRLRRAQTLKIEFDERKKP